MPQFNPFNPFGFNPMAMNRGLVNFALGMNQQFTNTALRINQYGLNTVLGTNRQMVNMALNPFQMLNQFQGAVNGQRLQNGPVNPEVQGLLAQRDLSLDRVKQIKGDVDAIGNQLGDATRGLTKAQTEMASLNAQGDGKRNTLLSVRKLALHGEIQKFQGEVKRLQELKQNALKSQAAEQNRILTFNTKIARISKQSDSIA